MSRPGALGLQVRAFDQIDIEISNTSDPDERLVLRARRACALARFSFISEARQEIAALRELNQRFSPRLTAWIIFCEGLIYHFDALDTARSMDRFRRAKAIGVAIDDIDLSDANSAWMANAQFMEGNVSSCLDHLNTVFLSARKIRSETLARAFLVLADLVCWSGNVLAAREWYKQARLRAVECGDLSLQSVVMFNSASFHVAEMTLQECAGTSASPDDIRRLALEVDSVANLDQGIGQPHLEFMISLLRADVLILMRNWESAVQLIDQNLPALQDIGPARLVPKLLSQRARALAMLGDYHRATNDCTVAEEHSVMCSDLDDSAVLRARLADAYQLIGESERSVANQEALQRCLRELRRMRSDLTGAIEKTLVSASEHRMKNPA